MRGRPLRLDRAGRRGIHRRTGGRRSSRLRRDGSSDPVELASALCRDRGRVVIVGDVGLTVPRAPFYEKELELRLSRSYGPGRYDPSYEEHGNDYPIGYVRWTEQRNLAEFLRLVGDGLVDVDSLTTHRFPIEQAPEAYDADRGTPAGERCRAAGRRAARIHG